MTARDRGALVVATALVAAFVAGCGAKPADDGAAKLVYSVYRHSGTERAGIFTVDSDGTHHTRLTRQPPPGAGGASWSPVGDTILFSNGTGRGGEIWTINPDGTGARKIADGTDASWSPDGREIAVAHERGSIEILSADGERLRTVDSGTGSDPYPFVLLAPVWSPDGSKLAFDVAGSPDYGLIYVAPADGKGKASPLEGRVENGVDEIGPVWSPDGKRLAFTRTSAEGLDEAWTSRIDGSDRKLVASKVYVVAWSRDENALVCASRRGEGPLYRYPLDGGPPQRLSGARERRIAARDRLSPDGTRLVSVKESGALIVSRADGTQPKRLTEPFEELSPDWSPDGKRVAFARFRGSEDEGEDYGIYVIGADGEGEHRIATGSEPDWSPDGSSLTVQAMEEDEIDVVRVDADGVKPLRDARSPAWSPDGTTIAFARDHAVNDAGDFWSALYTVRPDATGLRALATTEGSEHPPSFDSPVWMPDGQRILIEEDDPLGIGNARVREILLSGAPGRTIVTDKPYQLESLAVSPDGKTIAVASDDGIKTISVDSGSTKLIVPARRSTVDEPAWSPDGTQIAYVGYAHEGESKLYVVQADGTRPRLISKPFEVVGQFDWRPEAAQD